MAMAGVIKVDASVMYYDASPEDKEIDKGDPQHVTSHALRRSANSPVEFVCFASPSAQLAQSRLLFFSGYRV
jgi:hypothetical protein